MYNLAFVFPSQGSQYVGMLSDLYENNPIIRDTFIRDTFIEASDALNFDLADLILNGPAEHLNRTDRTQPALLASTK